MEDFNLAPPDYKSTKEQRLAASAEFGSGSSIDRALRPPFPGEIGVWSVVLPSTLKQKEKS